MEHLYDEMAIRIRPIDGTITVEEHTRGIISVKNIAPDDLLTCFERGIKEPKALRSGFLPRNCVHYEQIDSRKTVTLWIPPGYIDLTYFKTVYEHFPIPAMVFSFTVNANGRVHKCRAAIIADEAPTPKTQLYIYPFSNIDRDSRICIGAANSLPEYNSLRTIGTLTYHILSLPNNDHYFSRTNNKPGLGYRDLLEHLKDKEPSHYYDHILIPMKDSFQDFIDDKIQGGRA